MIKDFVPKGGGPGQLDVPFFSQTMDLLHEFTNFRQRFNTQPAALKQEDFQKLQRRGFSTKDLLSTRFLRRAVMHFELQDKNKRTDVDFSQVELFNSKDANNNARFFFDNVSNWRIFQWVDESLRSILVAYLKL